MPEDTEIRAKFWKALRSDRTVMLGLEGAWAEPPRPMTAIMEDGADHGPIWFFTARSTGLAHQMMPNGPALFTFASRGHDLFATLHGTISEEADKTMIDRLWSPFIAAWYEGGKDDPDLLLLKLEPQRAEIWLNGNSLVAGLKMLLGRDPKEDYAGNVAKGPV